MENEVVLLGNTVLNNPADSRVSVEEGGIVLSVSCVAKTSDTEVEDRVLVTKGDDDIVVDVGCGLLIGSSTRKDRAGELEPTAVGRSNELSDDRLSEGEDKLDVSPVGGSDTENAGGNNTALKEVAGDGGGEDGDVGEDKLELVDEPVELVGTAAVPLANAIRDKVNPAISSSTSFIAPGV